MALPRAACLTCSREIALTRGGRLYRHDPRGGRTPDLKSCPGSLKVVRPPAAQPVLFTYEPPAAAPTGCGGAPVEMPGLFDASEAG